MIDGQSVSITVAVCMVITCTAVACAFVSVSVPTAMSLTCNPLEKTMSDEITIRETTQPTLSDHLIGVSNIWERELADPTGVIKSRLSASLSISNLASKQIRIEKVFAGSVISLGIDRYCVASVEEGKSTPGSITLRKLVS